MNYITLEKKVGETPLSCIETYRAKHPELKDVAMAYAGRLDPMASGKLLVLLGDECKIQEKYHGLDKEYKFSVLLGISSDTHDVLGRLTTCKTANMPNFQENQLLLKSVVEDLIGPIDLPYPHFSAKTVQNKPLHMWTLEGRLNEIEIPINHSTIYELELIKTEVKSRAEIAYEASAKIDTIPPVTDLRKVLGNDFRRIDVRKDWAEISKGNFGPTTLPDEYRIAHFRCVATSGTYMRSLAHLIGKKLNSCGLAWYIHRTKIGTFDPFQNCWTVEY